MYKIQHQNLNSFRSYQKLKEDQIEVIENSQLLCALEKAKEELEQVYKNLDFAEDVDLIDSYIYEAKALQYRYEYLLKKIKERNLSVNIKNDVYKFR